MQLYVPMSMPTLRLLWLVQVSKGVFSLQWPLHIPRDERVTLVLAVGEERVSLGGRVRSCTPGGGSYQVELSLVPLPDATRMAMEEVAASY